ncbi:MAG: TonB-dependent receptor [Caulobacterales bacterium]|nr:TonB-dependent receptor [Caulobacterales bacterium]
MSKKISITYALLLGVSLPSLAFAQNAKGNSETIIITAPRPSLPSQNEVKGSSANNDGAYDAASVLDNSAGVAVIKNGTQTGIIQLRGLSQDRVKVVVDGVEINPACPNHMDPPLHYVEPHQIEQIAIIAGVTSVVNGGDSIGGTVIVNTKAPKFSNSGTSEFGGNLFGKYIGANNGYEGSADLSLGLENAAFSIATAKQYGEDIKYKGGKASDTGFEIRSSKIEGALKFSSQIIGLQLGTKNSRNVGTPSLAMDMAIDDATNAILSFSGDYSIGKISARIFENDINHVMDNYTNRTYTPLASRMRAPATSRDYGFAIGNELKALGSILRFGIDGHQNLFNVYSQNISTNMKSDLFKDSKRNRLGIYGEMDRKISEKLRIVFGARYENIKSESGNIENIMMMGLNPAKLAFNALDKTRKDNNWDITTSGRLKLNDNISFELAAAQKTRSPSLVERYIWTPSSTYGAADGRNYIGNVDLNPEISRQISILGDFSFGMLHLKQSVFFNKVDDFIQGVAISAAPDATLKFSNINAELSGAETTISYIISDNLRLDGNVSYVRGKNTTNDDNLYRIAPINGNFALTYQLGNLEIIGETKFAAKQDKVSKYNSEAKSPAWSILNLRGRYNLNDDTRISFGVENLFDKYYYDHLSGLNRVNNVALGGSLAMGVHVPNPGRFGYIGLNYSF